MRLSKEVHLYSSPVSNMSRMSLRHLAGSNGNSASHERQHQSHKLQISPLGRTKISIMAITSARSVRAMYSEIRKYGHAIPVGQCFILHVLKNGLLTRDHLQVARMERTEINHGNGGVPDVTYQRMTIPQHTLAGVEKKRNHGLFLVYRLIPVVKLAGRIDLGSAHIIAR